MQDLEQGIYLKSIHGIFVLLVSSLMICMRNISSLSVVRLNFYYVRSYQMVVGRNIGVLFRVSASHFFSLFLLGLILILVRRELNRNLRLILFVEFWI